MGKLKEEIDVFEEKISKALQFKYCDEDEKIRKHIIGDNILVKKININEFYNLYLQSGIYPKDRLEKIIKYLMDIKMQLYFIIECDLGIYNREIHDKNIDINDDPHIFLKHLSLDQNLIFKSRVLWERLMNFIYFLETGIELESKKSKKKKFWEFLNEKSKWRFLIDYKDYVNLFDDCFRTPEAHKYSMLRSHFINNKIIEPSILFGLTGILINIWDNISNIIQGKEANGRYWGAGLEGMNRLKQ